MPRGGLIAALCAASVAAAACDADTARPARTVVIGATAVEGPGGGALPDAVVVVDGGRVVAMGPRSHTPVPKGATLVDGAGAWLVAVGPDGAIARLGPGFTVDLRLVEGDPREDPANLRRVRRVIGGGRGTS